MAPFLLLERSELSLRFYPVIPNAAIILMIHLNLKIHYDFFKKKWDGRDTNRRMNKYHLFITNIPF